MLVVVRFLNISSTVVRALLLMCLLVDAVRPDIASYCARGARWRGSVLHRSVFGGGVENTVFLEENPGDFPRGLLF